MKRFVGLLLALAGGAVMLWGVVGVLTGSSDTRAALTDELSVTALMAALVGVTGFTVGLIWVRDCRAREHFPRPFSRRVGSA